MKPIFAIDISSDKKNEKMNGGEFIVKTVAKQSAKAFEERQEKLEKSIEATKLPLWMRIVQTLCGFFGLIVAAATVKAGFETAIRNAPLLVFAGGVCIVVWGILFFASKQKAKSASKENRIDDQTESLAENMQGLYDELGVPESALSVDVLTFRYKLKNGVPVAKEAPLQPAPYINIDVKMYKDNGGLCIADAESVYRFDISELREIKTVNKRISVMCWNKEGDPRKGEFKQYKMTVNNMGCVYFKPYYILEIEHGGEIYGVYFPVYELEAFKKLIGLPAQE